MNTRTPEEWAKELRNVYPPGELCPEWYGVVGVIRDAMAQARRERTEQARDAVKKEFLGNWEEEDVLAVLDVIDALDAPKTLAEMVLEAPKMGYDVEDVVICKDVWQAIVKKAKEATK